MKIIDNLFPEIALRKAVARKKLEILNAGYSYHGASGVKKSLIGWLSKSAGPDDDIVRNVEKLRERSRDMFMGGAPIATGALKTIRTNVIGPGLRLNAQIDAEFLGMNPDEADEWERNTEREFALWAESKTCDASLANNFYQLQALAFLSMMMSGDAFALLPVIQRQNSPYDLRIYLLEADRVCDPLIKDSSKNVLGGVETGNYGEPIAYHIAQKHPGNSTTYKNEWKRVLAYGSRTGRRNVLHLMDHERPEQRRGVPLLAPVIEQLKQLGRYTDAELMAAVVTGMLTVFIESENPQNTLGEGIPYLDQIEPEDESSYELGNGAIVGLAPGEKANTVNPLRPNTAFDGFVISICRQIGVALELPFELLIKHFTASYSASRAALLEAHKFFRMRRAFIGSDFCQPIYEEWLFEAVAKERVYAPGFLEDPAVRKAYSVAEWYGPSFGVLDPTKEVAAAKIRVDEGFSTREKETAELSGLSYDYVFNKRVREEQKRRDSGLVTINTQGTSNNDGQSE